MFKPIPEYNDDQQNGQAPRPGEPPAAQGGALPPLPQGAPEGEDGLDPKLADYLWARIGRVATPLLGVRANSGARLRAQVQHLQQVKEAAAQGDYDGLAQVLQDELDEYEAQLEAATRKLATPRGELKEDEHYFLLKKEIMAWEKMQQKVADSPEEKEMLSGRVNELKKQQKAMERGQAHFEAGVYKRRIEYLQELQQFLSALVAGK